MSLSHEVAKLYADLDLRTAKYDAKLKSIKAGVAAIDLKPIDIKVNTARLDAAMEQIKAFRSALSSPISVRFAGGSGGSRASGTTAPQRQTYAREDKAARKAEADAIRADREKRTTFRNEARGTAKVDKQFNADEIKAQRQADRAAIQAEREKRAIFNNEAANSAKVTRQFVADEVKFKKDSDRQQAISDREKAQIFRNEARNTANVDKQFIADEIKFKKAADKEAARSEKEKAEICRNEARNTAKVNRQILADEVKHAKETARQVIAAAKKQAAEVRAQKRKVTDFGRGLSMGIGNPYMGMGGPATMAGYAIAKGAKESVQEFGNVEAQLAEIGRVSGMTKSQVDDLWKSLQRIGQSQPGVSVHQLLATAEQGGRMGIKGGADGLAKFTSGIARVHNAAGGGMPIDEMTEGMGKLLNVFEMGTDKIENLGAALVDMDNQSIASMQDLLDVATRLSGVAHAIKMDLPTTIALAGAAKDSGLSNEVAGTFMSQLMTKLATNRGAFAKQIGIPKDQLEAMYRRNPMEAAAASLRKLHETSDPIEGLDSLSDVKMKGARSGGAFLQLASQIEKLEPKITSASNAWSTMSPLIEADAIKAGLLNSEFQKLENSMTSLATSIGERLRPAVSGALGVTTKVVNAAQTAVENGALDIGGAGAAARSAMPKISMGGALPGLGDIFKKALEPAAPKKEAEVSLGKAMADGQSAFMSHLFGDPKKKGDGVLGEKWEKFKAFGGMAANVIGQTGKNMWSDIAKTAEINHKQTKYESYGSGLEAGQALQDRLVNQEDTGKEQLKTMQGLYTQGAESLKALNKIAGALGLPHLG